MTTAWTNIRAEVAKLRQPFQGACWREKDAAQAYPQEFVQAQARF